jgi:RluA family pseudouridine synthase
MVHGMPVPTLITVRQPESGLQLDRFLTMKLGISRKQAKRLLDERRVFVNKRRIWIAHHELRMGDVVEAAILPRADVVRKPELRLLYSDARCLVVDKPAGLVSLGPESAESRIKQQHPEILPVHRLDRDTSGCLLFARTPEAQAAFEAQFSERTIEKVYQAIAMGPFPHTLKEMDRPVEGQTAHTEFRLLRRTPQAAHIEARPHTGRTHQIRVHLQAAGFPLAGDRTYATRKVKDDTLRHIPRQMLHAWRLSWRDPDTGAQRRVQATPPEDFRAALIELGLAPARIKRGGGR